MIFITGPHNSGKSTLARWFEHNGFYHIETGNIIRATYSRLQPGVSFEDWAEKMNHEQPDYFNQLILDETVKDEEYIFSPEHRYQDLVITGNRQRQGVEYLIKSVQLKPGTHNLILYLDANPEELYRRQLQRTDRVMPGVTFESFKEYLAFDERMGIAELQQIADNIINSDRNIQEIIREVEGILSELGYHFEHNREMEFNHQEITYGIREQKNR